MSDDKHRRAETGPMAFGNDWPGIFIRGDNAGYYSMILSQYLKNPEGNHFGKQMLEGLADLLGGCRATGDGDPQDTQYIKDFNEVVLDKKER